jgi:hypothetical protein
MSAISLARVETQQKNRYQIFSVNIKLSIIVGISVPAIYYDFYFGCGEWCGEFIFHYSKKGFRKFSKSFILLW